MESQAPRPARTTCSVPGFFHGISKLCKLTKVCAAPPSFGCDDDANFGNAGGFDEKLVLEILLQSAAALKSAYIKLQRAHIPYEPSKIADADETVASELDSVAALECLCTSTSSAGVGALIDERWLLVQRLEAEMRKRESGIVVLRRELEGLRRANSRLAKQIKMMKPSVPRDKVPRQLTMSPGAFLELFMAASSSTLGFAELIATRSIACSSDRRTSNAHEQCRSKYSLEAHLWRTMLGACGNAGAGGEEEEVFDADRFDRIMRRRDPLDALAEHPSSGFETFCRLKYLAAVPPETERAMLGNLDHRAFVSRGGHPRTWFYRAFATVARPAWALRTVLAMSAAVATCGCSTLGEGAATWRSTCGASPWLAAKKVPAALLRSLSRRGSGWVTRWPPRAGWYCVIQRTLR